MSRVAEMTTSAVTNRGRVVKSSGAERKERMDTSSLMEQILSNENLSRAFDAKSQLFKAKPHAKSIAKFKKRMKELTCRSWGVSNDYKIMKLN